MRLRETWYGSDGAPKGLILRDDFSGQVYFLAREGMERPPRRAWQSVDELKAQLRALYGEPSTPAAALERAAGLRGEPRGKP